MQIEEYIFKEDVITFGREVSSFPRGIKEAFDELIAAVPDGLSRQHYGLSHMEPGGKIIYIAAAKESQEGEAEKLGYRKYVIPRGPYLSVKLRDWMDRTDQIKDVFHELMNDERADLGQQVIEWYQSDIEMLCLVRAKKS
jgi:predicted transcriptional regulator YdeE